MRCKYLIIAPLLLSFLPAAPAFAGGMGETALNLLQKEHAWLEQAMQTLERQVKDDEARFDHAEKEAGKREKGCKEVVCEGRENAAVLFARLYNALLNAGADAEVLAHTYEDVADNQMPALRELKRDMKRSQSAIFWQNNLSALADFTAQMAYALATGDATSIEDQLGVLAAAASEYAVNKQLDRFREPGAKYGERIGSELGLPAGVMSHIAKDWSWAGVFEYAKAGDGAAGRIKFKPTISAISNFKVTAGSVVLSKVVDGVIRTGHAIWGGVDFAANYDEKLRMHSKALRDVLALRVASAFAKAEAKYLREQKHRLDGLFEREAQLLGACRREEKRRICEQRYKQAMAKAEEAHEQGRDAVLKDIASRQDKLERLKREHASTLKLYSKVHDEYFNLRKRWHDAKSWQQDEQFRDDLKSYAEHHNEAKKEVKYYQSLPPAGELEKQVRAMRKRLLEIGRRVDDLEMAIFDARLQLRQARKDIKSRLADVDAAYQRTIREAQRTLEKCAQVSLPQMHAAFGARTSVRKGDIVGWDDVMKPVREAFAALDAMFSKKAFEVRPSDKEDCGEKASAISKAKGCRITYDCSGTNPDGSVYKGKVTLRLTGGRSFQVHWRIHGKEWYGEGRLDKNGKMHVRYTGAFDGDGTWTLMSDGSFKGVWRSAGGSGQGSETWTPLSQEPLTNYLSPQGRWSTSEGGMEIRVDGVKLRGRYDQDNGRLLMTIRGNHASGYWIEDDSDQRCGKKKDGSYHWGRAEFEFDGCFRSFTGWWSYCGSAGLYKQWTGRRE